MSTHKIKSIDFRLEWLFKEIELLEKKIEFYDSLSFKIKGWVVVPWFALMSFAINESDWRISLISIFLPVLFVLIESSYKRYQNEFIRRTRNIMKLLNDKEEIEKCTNGDNLDFPIYDLLNVYGENKEQFTSPINNSWEFILYPLKKASVSFFYCCLLTGSIIITLILYFL